MTESSILLKSFAQKWFNKLWSLIIGTFDYVISCLFFFANGKEENVCRDNQEPLLLSNELNISTHQEKNRNHLIQNLILIKFFK